MSEILMPMPEKNSGEQIIKEQKESENMPYYEKIKQEIIDRMKKEDRERKDVFREFGNMSREKLKEIAIEHSRKESKALNKFEIHHDKELYEKEMERIGRKKDRRLKKAKHEDTKRGDRKKFIERQGYLDTYNRIRDRKNNINKKDIKEIIKKLLENEIAYDYAKRKGRDNRDIDRFYFSSGLPSNAEQKEKFKKPDSIFVKLRNIIEKTTEKKLKELTENEIKKMAEQIE